VGAKTQFAKIRVIRNFTFTIDCGLRHVGLAGTRRHGRACL